MKKLMQVLMLVLCVSGAVSAQQPAAGARRGGHERGARIHAAKMAYLTDRLQLTAKQSGDFIPLYNEYENELKGIRRSFLGKFGKTQPADMDDATAKGFVDDNLDYQQEVLNLKRRYKDRFLKVLSPQQLADLNTGEREFRQMLKARLEERKAKM